jgi:hypothetical protein
VFRQPCTQFLLHDLQEQPSIDWKRKLTQIPVGRNLDFSCTGHIFRRPCPAKGWIAFFEKDSMYQVSAEAVLVEVLENPEIKAALIRFSSDKE